MIIRFIMYFCAMLRISYTIALVLTSISVQLSLAQNHGGYGNQEGGGRPIGSIQGVVNDEDGTPVEYATVSLFRMRDSSLTTGAITDATGSYKFDAKAGRYYMKIEFISFTPKILTNIKVLPDQLIVDLKTTTIARSVSDLGEVEISAEKSQVEIGIDKKVFNVAKDLSNVGGTASEVLENVPSVIVDIDGNVSLRGSSNVRILIDGKPSGLMGISPAKALEQIPANTIESIEIITNPSVRYDAEGLAGIINIILKKDRAAGFNGLLNVTTGYPHRHNVNLTFNYKVEKMNFFGTLGMGYRQSPGSVDYHRETTINDTVTILDQDGDWTRGGFSQTYKLGMDYFVGKKSTITISGGYSPSTSDNERTTEYFTYDYSDLLREQSFRATLKDETESAADFNFGYVQQLKKKGQKMSIDFRISEGLEDELEDINQEYKLLDYTLDLSSPLIQRNNIKEQQRNIVAQIDYVVPMEKSGKIEFGYKSGFQFKDIDYQVEEYSDSSNAFFNLDGVSNHFIYDEDVHAVYGLYANKINKLSYQAGLRMEQTFVNSTLKETNEVYTKEYLNFFPSVHLSQELTEKDRLSLSYSRRIKRPRSRNLNPFNSYADPLNQWVGNPDLNPELTHSFEIGHLKYWEKSFLGSSIYYRHTDSVITRIRLIDSDGVSTTQPYNLSTKDQFGVELTFSNELTKKWKVNGSFNYFRSILDGGILGEQYNADAFSYTGRLNSNIKLGKGINFQIMYNYRGARVTAQGTRKAMSFMDMGIKMDILKKKGSLNLKLSDVFNTRVFVMETFGEGFYIETRYRHASRVFFINFTYKINKYKAKRSRRGGYDMQDMGM